MSCYFDLSVKMNAVEAELRVGWRRPRSSVEWVLQVRKEHLGSALQRRLEPQPVLIGLDAFVFGQLPPSWHAAIVSPARFEAISNRRTPTPTRTSPSIPPAPRIAAAFENPPKVSAFARLLAREQGGERAGLQRLREHG